MCDDRSPLLLTKVEVRERLGPDAVGRNAVDLLLATGRLRSIRIGRRVLVPRGELDRFINVEMSTGGDDG